MEDVKNQNSDEYAEVIDICNVYKVLTSTQILLNTRLSDLTKNLEDKSREVINYERTMETKIMSLQNVIANLNLEYD